MSQIFQKKLFKHIVLIIFIFTSFITYPQAGRESYKILGINVQGNKSADVATIIANSGLKIGSEIQVPGDQTGNAIRQLYSLGIFKDVQILMDKQISTGIFLLIKVEEYPRVEKVVIEGNDEISTKDIEEKVSFVRSQTLKPQEVFRVKEKILALYEKEGYLNAQVSPQYFIYFTADTLEDAIEVKWRNEKDFSDEYVVKYDKEESKYSNLIDKIKDRVLLKIEIKENDKVIVRKIEFTGNKAFDDSDLRGTMDDTKEAVWWKFWSSAQFNPKKYEDDKKLIIKHYRSNGYRDAEILSDSLIYSKNKKDLTILINLFEGPQYKIRNITWEGNTVYPSFLLTDRLNFSKGDVYNYDKFEKNLFGNEKQSDVNALYQDNGYLTVAIKPTEKKVAKDSVDIDIRIEERNQFRIGQVEIRGNDKTKDKIIRRELYTIPGDFYNRGLLFRSVQQLANLQYFNTEKLYGPQGIVPNLANDSTVNITYNVEEKSSDYFNASVGYSGSFGFSGAIGITLNNFSLDHPFTVGGGQILSFNWQFGVGNVYRTFSVGFTEPWLMDTPTLVGFEVFDTRQQYIYDLRQSGGTLRVGRRLKWPDDYFYIQGLFRYQYNNVLEGSYSYRKGISHQYTIGTTITRRDIDNPIFPSQGSAVSLNAELSGGPFLPGDVDYYKVTFKSEWYNRLFNSNRITLYTVADLGYINELVKGTHIQPFEYFFMGGNGLIIATTPLRGYGDREVGPKDIAGNTIGGKVMTRYTAELRFAVTMEPMPLYLLAFAEAGNVFADIKNTDLFNLRRSVGVGARIMINPIGLIGFDLGYGFDRMAVEGKAPSWIMHFQFGKGF